jgi:outer membrane immunogenic protein
MRTVAALLAATTSLFMAGAQVANSADLPTKAPRAPLAAPVWSWTGFYIGAHVGGGWGTIESELTNIPYFPEAEVARFSSLDFPGGPFPIASGNVNGFLGGGQIGYNFQSGIVVFGVEADASWSNIKGTTPCIFILSCKREVDFLGTITGRLGFTADRALIYVKGGGAWAHVEHDVQFSGVSFTSADKTLWGWTVGAGVEYAITENFSAKLEYNYMDFGSNTLSFPIQYFGAVDVDTTTSLHVVKFGVNYRFGSGPVVARY